MKKETKTELLTARVGKKDKKFVKKLARKMGRGFNTSDVVRSWIQKERDRVSDL